MLWQIPSDVVNLTASYVREYMPDGVTAVEILSNVRTIGSRALKIVSNLRRLQSIMV